MSEHEARGRMGWTIGGAAIVAIALAAVRCGPSEVAMEAPTPAPVAREAVAPTPVVRRLRSPRRERAEVPARQASEAGCDDFEALSIAAIEGLLEPEALGCLEGYRLAEDLEAAAFASDLLMVQAWAAGDMDAWRALAVDHVSAIEPEDATLILKLALDASRNEDDAVALASAEDGLAAAEYLDELDRDQHVDTLHRIRLQAMTRQDYPADEIHAAAEEWYAHNTEAERDTTTAERVCTAYGEPCGPTPEAE
ncbi:MAG: hypothetical protein EP330_10495 [Deltaproteobacteria bacterium]|nr:MAG: hypothetical protein EP330_10495 [Deltaproteobacteria bacterium]